MSFMAWSRKMPLAKRHGRMDVGLEDFGRSALKIEREVEPAGFSEPIGESMRLDREKSLRIEQGLDTPPAGGVAVDDGRDVGAESLADGSVTRDGTGQRFRDE
jgi:hypothetical protein